MKHHKDLITIVMEEAKKYKSKFNGEEARQALLIEFFLETYEKLKNKGLL